MSALLDNLIPLHGRLGRSQYAGWQPTRFAESGLGCHVDADVGLRMRDGTRLSADVYRPKKVGRYPAIVQIAAYNKELHASGMPKGTNEVGSPPVLTDRGYVQVLASRRGMGRSGGESGGFCDEQEIDDYLCAIEWAAEQPWCSGDVCLFGTSYYGLIQPIIAARRPPALRAMFANEICTDMFRHMACFGGSINNRFLALWLGANFKDSDFTTTVEPWQRAAASHLLNRAWVWDRVLHPRIDSVYESFMTKRPTERMRAWYARTIAESKTRDTCPITHGAYRELDRIKTPFVVVQNQGMWNIHQFGAFDLFERAGTPIGEKFLIVAERDYELPVLSWQLEALAFFDHVVKGCDNGYERQSPVRYWLEGANRFERATSFPPPAARKTRLYLAEDEALVDAAPATGEQSWTAVPLSAPLPDGMDEVMEQKLTFTKSFERRVALAGPVTMSLSFSSNEIDSYVVAALSRIDAGGRRHLLSLGAMRPTHRRLDPVLSSRVELVVDDSVVEPLVPGKPVTLRFSIVPTATQFQPGEKLELELASRTDLVRGALADGYIHIDMEAPPYFSRNTAHLGADSYVEVELSDG
ncbi:MAG: CocE/NonD family hydrolase [Polyangiaceae bacterium]